MSEFYKANRTINIYNPDSTESFKLSRSKIENFMACKRCFNTRKDSHCERTDTKSLEKEIDQLVYRLTISPLKK